VPFASITGYQPGARKAMVFWYRVEAGRPSEVRSRSVTL
jgi:hypothetical protein